MSGIQLLDLSDQNLYHRDRPIRIAGRSELTIDVPVASGLVDGVKDVRVVQFAALGLMGAGHVCEVDVSDLSTFSESISMTFLSVIAGGRDHTINVTCEESTVSTISNP